MDETVRDVLLAHTRSHDRPDDRGRLGVCRCGKWFPKAIDWSAHVRQCLLAAGVRMERL